VEAEPNEQAALVQIRSLRQQGRSLRAILAALKGQALLKSPRVAAAASDEMRCENKPMHQRLNLRLKALEKWLPDETKLHKALLPEWLMEDLRQQGIRFDASGRPEKSSMEEKAPERIAPATPAPNPVPPRRFYG
jgi:hypothetical protein